MFIGDGIKAYEMDRYLGNCVEPVGGVFVLIEITDADKDDPAIAEYTKTWLVTNPAWTIGDTDAPQYISHPIHDRKQYLQPQVEGDEFFTQLITTGRVAGTLAKFNEYIRER